MKKVLTIAGSDPSGGAGIQADIKTMTENGVYAMSVITAITAQNTMGVTGVLNVTEEYIDKQMDAVFSDIYPDAVKIGMLSDIGIIKSVAGKLKEYEAKNIVIDPVMISTSGTRLLSEEAIALMKSDLFPMASLITPNIPEAENLSGKSIMDKEDVIKVAKELSKAYDTAVLIKGGHAKSGADDLLFYEDKAYWFNAERIDNPNTHGTGCTLSSAIASNLAKGYAMERAVERAKEYILGAIKAMLNLGQGNGPMKHNFDNNSRFME